MLSERAQIIHPKALVSHRLDSRLQAGLAPKTEEGDKRLLRGLEHKSPQEQMEGCDYSGWMKKKSSSMMTTWKSRLFVLRGRRLSYYYTDTDTQEKGLIDISAHRVLPADRDFITGFHATVTGAKSSPVSPAIAHTPTLAAKDAAAQPESTLQKPASPSMFIFKLVPPRNGSPAPLTSPSQQSTTLLLRM